MLHWLWFCTAGLASSALPTAARAAAPTSPSLRKHRWRANIHTFTQAYNEHPHLIRLQFFSSDNQCLGIGLSAATAWAARHRTRFTAAQSRQVPVLAQCCFYSVTTRPAEWRNCYKRLFLLRETLKTLDCCPERVVGGGRTGLHRPACVNTHNLCSSLHCCIDSGGRPATLSPPQHSTLTVLRVRTHGRLI